MKNLFLVKGDITTAQVDAIVNAANPIMLGGGGVDGAIHKAAGPVLLEQCRKIKAVKGIRCPFGEARITGAGHLKSRYVIHAVGPIYWQEKNPEQLLASAYKNSLTLAYEYGCNSIAFPAISCGAYGYPLDEAAKIAVDECTRSEFSSLDVYFYLFSSELLEVWERVVALKGG